MFQSRLTWQADPEIRVPMNTVYLGSDRNNRRVGNETGKRRQPTESTFSEPAVIVGSWRLIFWVNFGSQYKPHLTVIQQTE